MIGILGLIGLYGTAYLLSHNRAKIKVRLLAWGIGLQLVFAFIIMKTVPGQYVFNLLARGVSLLLSYADAGAYFLFGDLARTDHIGGIFAFQVLPVVIFIASFFSVFYYIGLMQRIVLLMARFMHRMMGVSGAESVAAAANVFMGQTEAPIIIAPYIRQMTYSELMALMTGGMATVSGAVLASYVALGIRAEYLLAASVMAAPASLVMAKLLIPETERSATAGKVTLDVKTTDVNVIDAAARGAGQGVMLALNIGGMLIAFLALISLINGILGAAGDAFASIRGVATLSSILMALVAGWLLFWKPEAAQAKRTVLIASVLLIGAWIFFAARGPGAVPLRLELILGTVFAPIAFLMGVPWAEAQTVGELFGTKLVLNEFVAYTNMSGMLNTGLLSPKSELIASYALCGFANFSSVAIQIGGIGAIAPSRKADLAKLGLWAVLGGMMASYTVATLAGMISGL